MKWQQIIERMKFSGQLFGFGGDFTVPESETTAAHRIIKQLEDRRVLIDPPFREDVSNCVKSIQEIRGMLTEELQKLLVESKIELNLQAMRAACRRFLDELNKHNIPISSAVDKLGPDQASHFHIALGNLRAIFGIYIGKIAIEYNLDVHDDLASILPKED